MKTPREARKLARRMFRAACPDGTLDDQTARALADDLIARKPRHYVPILKEFLRLLRLEKAKTHAAITSAEPLSEPLRQSFQQVVTQRIGPSATLSFAVNPALLAGVRVQIGSEVLDGSLRARLESVRRALSTPA